MKVIFNPNKNPVSDSDRNQKVAEPGFGKYYTDNMVIAHWSESDGWQDAELKAYGPLTLDPVFHYLGQRQMPNDLLNLLLVLPCLKCQLTFLYKPLKL